MRLREVSGGFLTEKQTVRPWLPYVVACAIAAITWITLSPILKNDFILWDDNSYIFGNEYLGKPLSESIPYFFGPHFFIGNYHPLTMIAYASLYRIAGTEPAVFHSTSLLLHVLNVLLVFWLAWLLSGRKLMVAAFTSLLFGIHPMHVESVAWAAELKDVLYTFFFIAGLITYIKYIEPKNYLQPKGRVSLLLLTFAFFILSVLSKPAAIIFPVVLMVLDFYHAHPISKRTIFEKLPFIVVSIVFGLIAIRAQRDSHLLHDYYPLYLRVIFASYSLLAYIVKLIVPVDLSNFYPYPAVSAGMPLRFYFAPLLVILLTYCIYRTAKYSRVPAFGFLFYLVTVLLELQLISVGEAIMAERYTYVPYIGLFFLLGVLFDYLWNSANVKVIRPVTAILFISASLVCALFAYSRCKTWRNSETIAADLYSKHPETQIAAHNMAAVLNNRGQYREAIRFFSRVVSGRKDYMLDYLHLAKAYMAVNEPDSAFNVMRSAIASGAQDYAGYFLAMGHGLAAGRNYEPAAKFLAEYIRLQKKDPQGYIGLAECYYASHNYNSYINTVDSGLKYCPDNFNLLNHKGYALFVEGRYAQAIPYFQAAVKNAPAYQRASRNLAACYHAIDSMNTRKH